MNPHIESPSPVTTLGRVRWTICAMLFAATSINYMDRQVIAILKPTLQQSIGLTEVGYGNIVWAFQIAYALGLLLAGRFVDKVGTRIGYILVMAVWSLSAMGHALANTALEFGVARFFLGLGRVRQLPCRDQDSSGVVPAERAFAGYRNFQFRCECRRSSHATDCAVGNSKAWLARCVSGHWNIQFGLARMVVPELSQTSRSPDSYQLRTAAHLSGSR